MCSAYRHHSRFNNLHHNWEGLCDDMKKKDNFKFNLTPLILKHQSMSRNQLQTRRDNSQTNPAAKIVCGVEMAIQFRHD